jgi:hypothetical protein
VIRSSCRFSAVSQPGVSLLRRFCGTKSPRRENLVFWSQNQKRTHHKVGTARPPKAIHTAIYAEGACPYTHRATHNRHTECAGLPWWSFGSRCARIACRGSPHTFCTEPTEVRAHPCQVDEVAGRSPRLNCYGRLEASGERPAISSTWHGCARTSAVFVFCTIRLVQNVWGDPPQAILARLEPNDHQGSPAHSV